MSELQEPDTAIRTLGPSSGSEGDGFAGEFELKEETTTDKAGATRTVDLSLNRACLYVNNRPFFLQFLQHVCDSMEEEAATTSPCEPCHLVVELTYKGQAVRIETCLDSHKRA